MLLWVTRSMKQDKQVRRYLSHIGIKGFRNLNDVQVDLSPLTVLIGANGAGKSNFIRFFDLVNSVARGGDLENWVVREGGADDQLFMGSRVTNEITSSLRITGDDGKVFTHDYRLRSNNRDSLHISSEKISSTVNSLSLVSNVNNLTSTVSGLPYTSSEHTQEQQQCAKVISHFLGSCIAYQFHDTSKHAAIKKLHDINDNYILNPDADNLAPVLLNLSKHEPKRLKLIEKQISRLLPVFVGFVLEPQHGKIMLRWRHKQGDKVMGAHLTSDGSLRLFSLITLLNLPSNMLPQVILLDEPELGLHPNAITLIAAMIQRVSKSHQVILATQSPFMVNCFELDNIVVADQEDGATRLRKLDSEQYQEWLDDDFSVSELWLSNVLGGQP